ncbi:NRPB11 [Scenedesmus sp. PABB004]|nr:NRPB11 [Scenedesmus sp. PABB004]
MNQPDRYSRFVLPEGAAKVEYHLDTKNKNAGHYVVRLEDHTLGNLLRTSLHRDEAVVFAGYRIPHPLDPLMVVRVQTTDAKAPQDAMAHALADLKAEVAELKASLEAQVPRGAAGAYAGAAAPPPPGPGGYGPPPGAGGYDPYSAAPPPAPGGGGMYMPGQAPPGGFYG